MFVETFRFASEEVPLCSEDFILLDLYLLEVFRFASEEIPLCSEEFILLYSYICWRFSALQARRLRFLARNSSSYIYVC